MKITKNLIAAATLITALTACGGGDGAATPIEIPKKNTAPVANAGDDQTASDYSTINLDGAASSDVDADKLTYSWKQISGLPTVILSSTTMVNPEVILPNLDVDSTLEFELTVSDGVETAIDTVSITVIADNEVPNIIVESIIEATAGMTVQLDASSSWDPDNDALFYSWTTNDAHAIRFLADDGSLINDENELKTAKGSVFISAALAGQSLAITLKVDDGNAVVEQEISIKVKASHDGNGDVFIDSIDPTWLGLTAWQINRSNDENKTYYQGDNTKSINWSILATAEPRHNNIIDISFNSNEVEGYFRIYNAERPENKPVDSSETIDMSAFAGGNIIFDLKTITLLADTDLLLKLECIWPCQSSTQIINSQPTNEWRTISIPINSLVAGGLDLSQVDIGFQIFPTLEKQKGTHIQLDNIRWEKASFDESEATVFGDEIGPLWDGIGVWDDTFNGNYFDGNTDNHVTWSTIFSGIAGRGYIIETSFNDDSRGSLYIYGADDIGQIRSNDFSLYQNGQVSFDIKVLDYGLSTNDLMFKIDCIWPCSSGWNGIGRPTLGEWQTITVSIADLILQGLDITKVSTGLQIQPEEIAQQGVKFQLDNIHWKK